MTRSKGSRAGQSRSSSVQKAAPKIVGEAGSAPAAARLIDERIRELSGWRGETLARMRALILEAVPGIAEEWKWEVPVWSHGGNVCTGEAYAKVVKLTFARGASLPDPAHLFNSSLGGNTRRAIDITQGELVNARAFKALVKAAAAENASRANAPAKAAPAPAPLGRQPADRQG